MKSEIDVKDKEVDIWNNDIKNACIGIKRNLL